MRWELLLSPFYRYRNRSTDRLSILAKVTQAVTGGVEIKSRARSTLTREYIMLPAASLSVIKLSPSPPEAHHSPISSSRQWAGKLFL